MEIKASYLRMGGEVDFGNYGEYGKDRFRLSLRWNSETRRYEVYKHFFKTLTSNKETEEVQCSYISLKLAVQYADQIASDLSNSLWKDEVIED